MSELLKQLNEVWDFVEFHNGDLEYIGSGDPTGYVKVIQGSRVNLNREKPFMMLHLLDALEDAGWQVRLDGPKGRRTVSITKQNMHYHHVETGFTRLEAAVKAFLWAKREDAKPVHVCGAQGFGVGIDGLNDVCPRCEINRSERT